MEAYIIQLTANDVFETFAGFFQRLFSDPFAWAVFVAACSLRVQPRFAQAVSAAVCFQIGLIVYLPKALHIFWPRTYHTSKGKPQLFAWQLQCAVALLMVPMSLLVVRAALKRLAEPAPTPSNFDADLDPRDDDSEKGFA